MNGARGVGDISNGGWGIRGFLFLFSGQIVEREVDSVFARCASVAVTTTTVCVFCMCLCIHGRKGGGFVGWATLFLRGLVTSLEGRAGWNLRGVTVINSPFNNSCPTWPASPSQCPLCVYAYVYLCIHSMQEITTAGVQSLFFLCCTRGNCIGLTLGGEVARLKPSRYSFNPLVHPSVCVFRNMLTSKKWVLILKSWKCTKERNTPKRPCHRFRISVVLETAFGQIICKK